MDSTKTLDEDINVSTAFESPESQLLKETSKNGTMFGTFAESDKMGIFSLILATTFTAGIYYPGWFLSTKKTLNNLQSKEKLGSKIFVFAIILFSISLILSIISWVVVRQGEIEMGVVCKSFSRILDLAGLIPVWIQGFKVRRILNEHFNINLQKGVSFSWIATFFLGIYYLQYKINHL